MNRMRKLRDFLYPEPEPLTIDDEDAKPKLLMWARSEERAWYMRRRPKVHLFALLGAIPLAISAVLAQPSLRSEQRIWWAWILAGVGVAIWVYSLFPFGAARLAFREHRKKAALFRVELAHHRLAEDPHLPLNRLFDVTRKQLDAYQELTRRQQRAAFMAALASSVAGFAVLVTGVVVTLQVSPASEQYVVAGLTGVGSLLSAFITATFFVLSQRATRQLNLYYDEPRTTGQLILAERLLRNYASEHEDEPGHMIDQLLKMLAAEPVDDSEDQSAIAGDQPNEVLATPRD